MEDRGRPDSFSDCFLRSDRTAHFSLVCCFVAGGRALQRAAFWMEEPPSVRCADSSELFAGVCTEQLAERRSAASVADISVRRDVRDALAYFWRSDGYRTGPFERAADDGNVDRRGAFEVAYRGVLVRGDGAGLYLFWRFGHRRI